MKSTASIEMELARASKAFGAHELNEQAHADRDAWLVQLLAG